MESYVEYIPRNPATLHSAAGNANGGVNEGLLRFACYVVDCHIVYGQSFEFLTTEHILALISQLRPDMVKEIKTAGSGKLPPNIQKRKTKHLTASTNDAFATIRITAKGSTEELIPRADTFLNAEVDRHREKTQFIDGMTIEFPCLNPDHQESDLFPRHASCTRYIVVRTCIRIHCL